MSLEFYNLGDLCYIFCLSDITIEYIDNEIENNIPVYDFSPYCYSYCSPPSSPVSEPRIEKMSNKFILDGEYIIVNKNRSEYDISYRRKYFLFQGESYIKSDNKENVMILQRKDKKCNLDFIFLLLQLHSLEIGKELNFIQNQGQEDQEPNIENIDHIRIKLPCIELQNYLINKIEPYVSNENFSYSYVLNIILQELSSIYRD